MKVIQTNNKTWCFVGVPEDATVHIISGNILHIFNGNDSYAEKLTGTSSIFADSKTITEEQAAQVVEKGTYNPPENKYYKDYEGADSDYVFATGSIESLLRSLNLVGRQIILELLNNEK